MVYPGSMPRDVDILAPEKNTMLAFGALINAAFGTGTYLFGLAGTQTTVPSMTINIGSGSIVSLQNIDNSAFGSLAADTANTTMKQGINSAATPLALVAPTTAGQSVNYLIEAAFTETDAGAAVLGYVNAADPSEPFNGPANAGTSQNTLRIQRVNLVAKAGIAAATGTQTTPAADGGYVPLYVVTVAYGQTSILTSGITLAPGAPLMYTLPDLAAVVSTLPTYSSLVMHGGSSAAATGTTVTTSVNFTPPRNCVIHVIAISGGGTLAGPSGVTISAINAAEAAGPWTDDAPSLGVGIAQYTASAGAAVQITATQTQTSSGAMAVQLIYLAIPIS
jgi:hypothetical protein